MSGAQRSPEKKSKTPWETRSLNPAPTQRLTERKKFKKSCRRTQPEKKINDMGRNITVDNRQGFMMSLVLVGPPPDKLSFKRPWKQWFAQGFPEIVVVNFRTTRVDHKDSRQYTAVGLGWIGLIGDFSGCQPVQKTFCRWGRRGDLVEAGFWPTHA